MDLEGGDDAERAMHYAVKALLIAKGVITPEVCRIHLVCHIACYVTFLFAPEVHHTI